MYFYVNLCEYLKGWEGLFFWVMDLDCMGIFIVYDIDSNWIFMKNFEME